MTLDKLITYRNQVSSVLRELDEQTSDLKKTLQVIDKEINNIYEGKQGELPL